MYKFKDAGMLVPAYIYAEKGSIEKSCMEQVRNMSSLPFIFHHTALNPDGHKGYGMPIGGIVATRSVVIPNAVGADIGCAVMAVKTNLVHRNVTSSKLKQALGRIRQLVPVGFEKHGAGRTSQLVSKMSKEYLPGGVIEREWANAARSLGTLGGGNHFIEIQAGDDGYTYLMVHSGSRNLGFQVARHYNDIAIALNKKWFSIVPKENELAFLPLDSAEGYEYMDAMRYCVEYAAMNRKFIMVDVKKAISSIFDKVEFGDPIDAPHNYAAMENHFGKNVLVHRKGAIRARNGELGLIPGSQGTSSYIIEGKGCPDSFESCSHGAGRRMSRTQARRELDLAGEKKRLDNAGVIHSVRNEKDLDEAPGAYKDIETVMANQADLVRVLVELKPLAVIKG